MVTAVAAVVKFCDIVSLIEEGKRKKAIYARSITLSNLNNKYLLSAQM